MMAEPAFRDGLARLSKYDLSFDACLFHPQIPELTAMARAVPESRIVLDHFGIPLGVGSYSGRHDEVFGEWKKSVSELAKCENVVIKLGGLAMPLAGYGFKPDKATAKELAEAWAPYFDTSVELFGPSRCMFQSNFPVDAVSTSYVTLWNAFKVLSKAYSNAEKDQLFKGTASHFYRI
jgi:predicted TIM-barrel fold metal-dependent hydrolase